MGFLTYGDSGAQWYGPSCCGSLWSLCRLFFGNPSDLTVPTYFKRHSFFELRTCYAFKFFLHFFSNLVEEYMHETVTMLKLFEKDCMETYVAHEAKTKENSIDERLAVLEKK